LDGSGGRSGSSDGGDSGCESSDGGSCHRSESELKAAGGGWGSDSDGSADDAADEAKDGDETGDNGSDDGEVSVVQLTADQLVKGANVIALRDGEYKLGVVQFPSKAVEDGAEPLGDQV
jgi:hypothetical protein